MPRDAPAAPASSASALQPVDEGLRTPLDLAVDYKKEEAAAVLRAHRALHSLHFAAEKGMTDEVAAGIAAGQDVNARHQDLRTPLDLAVNNKKEEAAAVLRAHGALHSLHFAAQKGMTDEVAAGIAAGQDVDARDQSSCEPSGWTALHHAAAYGHGGVAEALLKAGCNKDIQDTSSGRIALHWAAIEGHGGVAEALLKGGCNPDIQDTDLRTPLDLAVDNYQEEAAAVLRAHGALHSLHFAAQKGMTDEVAAGIAAGQDVNARDQHGRVALELAANYEKGEVVGMLIGAGMAAGQDVNACLGRAGKTMLMCASEGGHEESVRALIEKGASLEAVDESSGWTALHHAAKNGHGGVAEALLKGGCNPDIQDKHGRVALELAANYQKGEVVGMLIGAGMAAGQDLNACLGRAGKTMLMCASEGGHEESVRALIEKGASLEAVDENDVRTALHYAAINGHGGVAEALLKGGCNPDIQDTSDGWTALHHAAKNGHGGVAEALLKGGCNKDIQDTGLRTPLDLAVDYCKEEAAAVLRAHGALHSLYFAAKKGMANEVAAGIAAGQDVNARDQSDRGSGWTALHYAAYFGREGVAEALLKGGCNPDIQDKKGKTAVQLAEERGENEVVAVLKEHMACGGRK